jgi:phage-related protein
MATFDDATLGVNTCPDFEASKRSQPKVRVASFGSGYEQRTTFGLNQNPKTWTLKWMYRSTSDADAIEAFLDARAADHEPFDWSPPDDASSYKWVCDEWDRTLSSPNRANISATFRQVFEA